METVIYYVFELVGLLGMSHTNIWSNDKYIRVSVKIYIHIKFGNEMIVSLFKRRDADDLDT